MSNFSENEIEEKKKRPAINRKKRYITTNKSLSK